MPNFKKIYGENVVIQTGDGSSAFNSGTIINKQIRENSSLPSGRRYSELHALLCDLYSAEGMVLLTLKLSNNYSLLKELNEKESRNQVALSVLSALHNHGLINDSMFRFLIEDRPNRAEDINKVWIKFRRP